MKIYPAIDIKGGKVVRLLRGDFGEVTEYSLSADEAARKFYSVGAEYLHAVDLDGAKSGKAENDETVKKIIAAAPLKVEIGGGIRSLSRIENYLSAGADSVILGTIAVRNMAFVKDAVAEFGDRISVGVDARCGKVAVSGWCEITDTECADLCLKLRDIGVRRVIYTDISRDGALSGTDMETYERLVRIENLKITASGGITCLNEIIRLKEMGIDAAILGRALYENKLSLSEAIAVARG